MQVKCNSSYTHSDKLEYKRLKKNVQRLISAKKTAFMSDANNIPANKPRQFWSKFKSALPKINTKSIPKDMSPDVFNVYFTNIPVSIDSEFSQSSTLKWPGPKSQYTFNFDPIPVDTVYKQLLKLGNSSNLDILDFDSKLLFLSASTIFVSLHVILSNSMSTGSVHPDWKKARVTPIFKGGDGASVDNPSDYRPISICCHIGKLLEKLVKLQLMPYLLKHNFISPDQSAYLEHHSTTTCLHRIVDSFLENINDGDITGICMVDITKCFDSINHELLLDKLKCYGFSNIVHSWFKSYLSDRKQAVFCNGKLSDFLHINFGVPQGSVLGPILFLLFVNDVVNTPLTRDSLINLFADDLIVCASGKTYQEVKLKIERNVQALSVWYYDNRLKIHPKKTKFMIIGSKEQTKFIQRCNTFKPFIVHGDNVVYECENAKYLGVELDSNLSWSYHVRALSRKLNFQYSIIKSLSSHCSPHLLRKYYNCYVQPRIDYAISIWGCTTDANISIIQRIQNRIGRFLSQNFDYNVSGLDILRDLKIYNIVQRRDYFLASLTYQSVNCLAPTYLSDHIVLNSDISHRSTRSGADIHLPRISHSLYRNSIAIIGSTLYNSLPSYIKYSTSIESFKRLYFNHIFT